MKCISFTFCIVLRDYFGRLMYACTLCIIIIIHLFFERMPVDYAIAILHGMFERTET